MLSKKIRDFFIPIFRKHKKIFYLLIFDGMITGIVSVITPLLLKFETDQLMGKKSFISPLGEIDPF
jgi:ABC-type bacteriocin/lantibiotic exporter with double-glycine peptidase domain